MEEEKREIRRLIKEDNVEEIEGIFNSHKLLQITFNTLHNDYLEAEQPLLRFTIRKPKEPLLLFAVQEKSQKVVEYLLSQDFVDKSICNRGGENIYHVVCKIRGAEELFSMIERKVPHNLILNEAHYGNLRFGKNVFNDACEFNNVFIVKRVYEIIESLQVDLTHIKNNTMKYAILNKDIEVIKYILSIDGIQLNDEVLFDAIEFSTIDIVIYLLNFYLYQSILSHLHNQFHIFQFSNHHSNYINKNKLDFYNTQNRILKSDYKQKEGEIIVDENKNSKNLQKRDRDDQHLIIDINHNKKIKLIYNNNSNNNNEDNGYEYYLKLVEDNYNKIMNIKLFGNRIWHCACYNVNLDVVQLIFSLKGIQPDLLINFGYNAFLIACERNSNIKVIKYLHKLFPSFIHSQKNQYAVIQNGASLILENYQMENSDKIKILHYLYLNGIDIHFLSIENADEDEKIIYQSIYSNFLENYGNNSGKDIDEYLKVISQDFDYLKNEHDDEAYRKPSFWKQFHNNNNNNNNNNYDKLADEQSMRINEWKNRYEEHVLRNLSKMIQEYMLQPNQNLYRLKQIDDYVNL